MDIQIRSQVPIPEAERRRIRRNLARLLEDLACHDGELSVVLTDDPRMARLNEQYLGRKGPTNVLAFPMEGGRGSERVPAPMLGDVVVSLDMAQKEAVETGESVAAAVDRLLIHGLLHLLGYDHERSAEEAVRMESEEARLRALLGTQAHETRNPA